MDERKKYKCNTCIHAESAGTYAVFVKPSCPRASMIKGRLVSSRKRCGECRSYKPRKGAGKHAETDKSDT